MAEESMAEESGASAAATADGPPDTAPSEERRCGFVAVMGAPNAGKSTLVNRLVGAKVSIVTHKAQTTRAALRGVALHGASQIILVDTPGIFDPRRRLDRAMVGAAWGGAEGADDIVLTVDVASRVDPAKIAAPIIEGLRDAGRTGARGAVLALNKIDLLARPKLLDLAARLNEEGAFRETFMISAQNGDGVEDLKARLAERMPLGPWHYPEDQIADAPQRWLAAEVTREKLFLRLHDELPYAATVETESWKPVKKGGIRIEQTIYVERDGQKAIILGKGGRAIKEIGAAARAELTEQLGQPVHLFLFVKVRKGWADDPARYRQMGLDIVE
ncbi:MAG: GTPase Era [Pseudomonadota bacterium]